MKNFKKLFLFMIIIAAFQSCAKDAPVIDRTTHLVTLENNTGITGCSTGALDVTFIVSYRDVQTDVTVKAERKAFINVLVEDNENIHVLVQNTANNATVADANIEVRTDSRPEHLGDETRRISYCQAFNLGFHDF